MQMIRTEEQQRLYQQSVEFASSQLDYDINALDGRHDLFLEAWKKCADFDVFGWCFPSQYGGSDLDIITTINMLEGLGYGCADNGLTLGINGQIWSVQEPLLHFGSEQQKEKYLARLCKGEMLAAHGMTEKESGSDAFSLLTRAEKVDGGYVLNGEKRYVGLAPVADIALVFARTDESAGQWGISAFIVERNFPGFESLTVDSKMGLRTNPFGNIRLTDCFVPEENRLGPEGSGVSIFVQSMDWERGFIFASHVGSMARQLDQCIKFARKREQFGKPVGQFQAISHRIAEMRLRLETSRLMLYQIASLKQDGKSVPTESAMAKLHISEAFVQNSQDAIRIHGALGYLAEQGVERDLRDAMGGLIYSGSSDIQRNIIARSLGL